MCFILSLVINHRGAEVLRSRKAGRADPGSASLLKQKNIEKTLNCVQEASNVHKILLAYHNTRGKKSFLQGPLFRGSAEVAAKKCQIFTFLLICANNGAT